MAFLIKLYKTRRDCKAAADECRANMTCGKWKQSYACFAVMVLDQIKDAAGMSVADVTQRGLRIVTGNLTVDFFNPVPVGEAMIVEVVTESRAGRRWTMQAMLRLERDPSPLARAIGVWVERREGHFERHEAAMRDYRAR